MQALEDSRLVAETTSEELIAELKKRLITFICLAAQREDKGDIIASYSIKATREEMLCAAKTLLSQALGEKETR